MVKYEERATVDATAPFHRSKYFFSFFFWKVCLCLFPVYLVGFLFFLFLVLPRGLTNIWILLDDEQCPYSRGIVYFNS